MTALVVLEGLASGQLSPADAAAWLSARLSPYSAPPGEEAPMRTHRPARRFQLRALNPKRVPRDDEIRRLRRQVTRLSDLLREHGIDPGSEPGAGDRRSA